MKVIRAYSKKHRKHRYSFLTACIVAIFVFLGGVNNSFGLSILYNNNKVSEIVGLEFNQALYDIEFIDCTLQYMNEDGWVTSQQSTHLGFSGSMYDGLQLGSEIANALGLGPVGYAPDPVKDIVGLSNNFIFNYFNDDFGAWEFEEYFNDGIQYVSEGQIQLGEFYSSYDEMLENPWYSSGSATPITLAFVTECQPVPEPTTLLLFGTGLVGVWGNRYRKRRKNNTTAS